MDTQINLNYDTAFGEDDEMSQTSIHNGLITYLILILNQLFLNQNVGVFTSISLYGDPLNPSRYKSPDLLVIDGLLATPHIDVASYYIGNGSPPPCVLMEISSEGNWQHDIEPDQKPAMYARMGVPEYFAVDPHIEQVWSEQWRQQGRLLGWQLNSETGLYQSILPDVQGRLWSGQLQSWLVMEGIGNRELHLYDQAGQLRLTGEETAQKQVRLELEQRLAAQLRAEKLQERLRQLDPNFNEDDW
jgi:Uma2 family endonuclease